MPYSAGGEQGQSPATATQGVAEPTADPLPGPAGGDAPPGADAPVLRWIPIGPASPADPPEGTLYELVRSRDCAGLRESTLNAAIPEVWKAAESACFALAGDRPVDWQAAAAALLQVPKLPPGRCWETAVTESVRQVVAFRAAHPAAAIPLVTEGAGDDCPRRLTGLTALDDQDQAVGIPGQATGPAAGRSSVRVTAVASPEVSGGAVFVYQDPASATAVSTTASNTPTSAAPQADGRPSPAGNPVTLPATAGQP
ncbi:hypothetical protein [Pseudarthrobacter sp. N5]|uniref:hypothetical protein n=1 Tax=Pseudarthrobacter sp. N5 TaxID=3418416 RepID=UPI003CF555FF